MKINDYGEWNSIITKIRNVAIKNGLHVYIVGGWVRDKLLGKKPKDLDLMVEGEGGGIKLGELVNAAYPKTSGMTSKAGKSFGVSKLMLDGQEIDLVAPRREVYVEHENPVDDRKPEVFSATVEEDAKRRDLSINALFIDLNNNQVVDFTGHGLNDLKNRVIRVANPEDPDTTMKDDPLRMLRLVRQSAQLNQYGFEIDPETAEAVKRNASRIKNLSRERIEGELSKMMVTTKPSIALRKLKEYGLLAYMIPELDKLSSTEEEGSYDSKDVWEHTLKVVDRLPLTGDAEQDKITRLTALFHDIGKPETKSGTYEVTCPKCSEPVKYVYKSQPNIGVTCENGTCGGQLFFKNHDELKKAFPKYQIHFFEHEKVGAEKASKILRNLKYSTEVVEAVKTLITGHMSLHGYTKEMTDSAIRRLLNKYGEQKLRQIVAFAIADITTKNPSKEQRITALVRDFEQRLNKVIEENGAEKIESPLDGKELFDMFPNLPNTGVGAKWVTHAKNFLINEIIENRLQRGDKESAKRILQNIDITKLGSDNSIVKLSWREL